MQSNIALAKKCALKCYREKYGCYTELDGYVIMFEPHLAVMEKI